MQCFAVPRPGCIVNRALCVSILRVGEVPGKKRLNSLSELSKLHYLSQRNRKLSLQQP